MSEPPPIPSFNLNHPKNYIGYTVATGIASTTADAVGRTLLTRNDENGNRITRDVDGAAAGARALGLISETGGDEALTERGRRIVTHAGDVYADERDALAALRELFGQGKRFIEALPEWEPLIQEILVSHDGLFRLIDLMADVHADRPEPTFPLPLLVQELYHRDPQFTKACFTVPERRHQLDDFPWGERGAERDSPPDPLGDRTLYRSSLVHQTKTLLWHAGIVTTKGTTRASLEFSADSESFRWGLTDTVRQVTVTATSGHARRAGVPADTEERARDTTPPKRVQTSTSRIIRNTALVKNLKREHDYRCQICNERRRRSRSECYAEGHHLHPLGEGGPDVRPNVLIVCPTCHADLDYGTVTIDPDRRFVRHTYDRSRDGNRLRTVPSHDVGREYIEYHNERADPGSDSVE